LHGRGAGAFLDALSIDPRAIAAWANLTLLEPGAAETAAAAAQVLALDPGQSGHRAIYAQVLLQLDDPQRSRDEFARLVAEHSQNPAYWAAYATALATAGDLETALDAVAMARELAPTLPDLDELERQIRAAIQAR
jgi:predicted Zn-dependent protease